MNDEDYETLRQIDAELLKDVIATLGRMYFLDQACSEALSRLKDALESRHK